MTIDEQPTDADLPRALAGSHLGDLAAGAERVWLVRQTFDDPAGDHDWGLTALVDLDASDAAGAAVLRVLDVGPR